MIDIKCMDSSAWLGYYFGEFTEVKKIVDGENILITSSLSLFEIKKKLLSLKKDPQFFLEFIKERSEIIEPTIEITEKAAEIAIQERLAAVDALIYTTSSMHDAILITGDNDFKDCQNVLLLHKKR